MAAINTALADRVTSADDYRTKQRHLLAKTRHAAPFMASLSADIDIVREGTVVRVHCPCGDWPSVYQPAQLACCCNCGAIYEHVPIPEDAP